ncbi:hypothetical protein ACQCVP_19170 [Rossellomorea vietnamensis]|uniref:hypothetical protein n=1 Tax=Rossellomorea vietnamensis TaxID=218284 RepID=UPI003CE9F180
MKKEFSLTRDNITYHFTILGFQKKQNSYGYVSDSSQTVYVFRGTERKAVIQEAKKITTQVDQSPPDSKLKKHQPKTQSKAPRVLISYIFPVDTHRLPHFPNSDLMAHLTSIGKVGAI